MKNIIIIVLSIVLFSSYKNVENREQMTLHNSNLDILSQQLKACYYKGWRIKHIVNQDVSTSIQTSNNGDKYSGSYRDLKGEIFIILEK